MSGSSITAQTESLAGVKAPGDAGEEQIQYNREFRVKIHQDLLSRCIRQQCCALKSGWNNHTPIGCLGQVCVEGVGGCFCVSLSLDGWTGLGNDENKNHLYSLHELRSYLKMVKCQTGYIQKLIPYPVCLIASLLRGKQLSLPLTDTEYDCW